MTTHRTAPPLSFGCFGGDKMGVVQTISDFFGRLLNRRAKELFGVKPVDTEALTQYLDRCARAYQGNPDWLDDDDEVVTINFAQTVCAEVARLATMNAEIAVTGSPRADWLQVQVNNILEVLRQWCEFGCAGGTVILKPYGNGTELVFSDRFRIVGTEAGKITGVVFIDRRYADDVSGQEENVASVSDCTLVNVANSVNVATRVLSYYNSKKTVAASIVLDGEKAGDFIQGNDPYDDPIVGFIASMETTVSAKNKANCRIITGYTPGGAGNNYTRSKILTGTGTIDLVDLVRDKEDKHVQITLLGGGHGGGSGQDGEPGGRASANSHGSSGAGGEPGTPGPGGDVVTVTLDLTGYDSYVVNFSCGEGGESDTPGGATTLGEFSSATGAPSSNGITDIFTGAVYGQRGKGGVAGAKGSGSDGIGPNLTYEGVTYHPGASGENVDGAVSGAAYGGRGGGAAPGVNGGNGQDGSTDDNKGHGFNTGGTGGRGGTPPQRATAAGFGQGGDAGHGGGGGGGGGAATGPEQYSWPGGGGPGGKGGLGAKGGPGLIMIYF